MEEGLAIQGLKNERKKLLSSKGWQVLEERKEKHSGVREGNPSGFVLFLFFGSVEKAGEENLGWWIFKVGTEFSFL